MDPVGYKRINKKTGQEMTKENIVKGIAYEPGQYVVISDQDIAAAYPRTTQTIEIEAFVNRGDIPFVYLERPYYVAPINKGAKVYALLRETLLKTGKVGVARVVIQTRQHLAALIPSGRGMVLNLLRWGDDVRPVTNLDLPPEGAKSAGLAAGELKMAEQLVASMSTTWQPDAYKDEFKNAILKLVDQRVKAGDTESVTPLEAAEEDASGGAQIFDLTKLLKRSLNKKSAEGKPTAPVASNKPAAKKAPPKSKASVKSPAPKRRVA